MTKLKRCPFCGNEKIKIHDASFRGHAILKITCVSHENYDFIIGCNGSIQIDYEHGNLESESIARQKLIAAWNNRTDPLKLRPCAYCGWFARLEHHEINDCWMVICDEHDIPGSRCFLTFKPTISFRDYGQKAIKKWNERYEQRDWNRDGEDD